MVVAIQPQPAAPRAALLAGASGVTGAALLQLLLQAGDYGRVHALSRRPLPLDHPRLTNRIVPLSGLGERLIGLRCDDAYCCIGAAGGPSAAEAHLREVDVELVRAFAVAAQSAGASRLVVVSAVGADPLASHAFRRAKGAMEEALRELKFQSVEVLRPAAVVGVRPQGGLADTLRLGLAPFVNPLLRGPLARARWMEAGELAAAMLGAARAKRRGFNIHAGARLPRLAETGRQAA